MKSTGSIIASVALTLFMCAAVAGQQSSGARRVPRLTTEDVMRQRASEQVVEQTENVPKSSSAASQSEKVSPEELSWREAVKRARERAKSLERAAEETELRITELRNQLGISGQTPRFRNETAAELEATGQKLTELRAQAQAAAEELNRLLEEGKAKGFSEGEGLKPVSEDGKPNEQFYRARYAELMEALETAERRIQLYENRVRDLNQRILINSGGKGKGGDNFFNMTLAQERDEAQRKLDQAIEAREKARRDLEALKQQARQAGLPLSIFK
jgi:DNA repair exonuclease SbcCD ATPase subunit